MWSWRVWLEDWRLKLNRYPGQAVSPKRFHLVSFRIHDLFLSNPLVFFLWLDPIRILPDRNEISRRF